MKTSKQCPKCDSLRIGHLEYVLDMKDSHHVEAALGQRVTKKSWVMTLTANEGTFEAYLCADCGYYETYVKNPGGLKLDEIDGFSWVNQAPPRDGAYR